MTTDATPTVIHLTKLLERNDLTDHNDVPGGSPTSPPSTPSDPYSSATPTTIPPSSSAIPSSIPDTIPSTAQNSPPISSQTSLSGSSSSASFSGGGVVFTSRFPVTTITGPSTTFTSFGQSIITSSPSSSFPAAQTIGSSLQVNPVCIGDGLDLSSIALLSTVLVPSLIGLLLWLLFAIIRPRYRQVYGLREWFVQPSLRPKPLSRSLWAFLFPHVPLVPSVPSDVSDAGTSPSKDAELFPSDEALSQRTLWLSLIIVAIWSVIGAAGMLPLYIVSTPCLAESASPSRFTGVYSTLQDISLLRLLQLLDSGNVTTVNLVTPLTAREIVNGKELSPDVRTRIIIITALAIALGVIPVLWKLLREFNKLVAYRNRWIEVKCQGQEMGWLSARDAPGFTGWGEKRLKDFIMKAGLSASLDSTTDIRNGNRGSTRRRRAVQEWSNEEKANLEIDVQTLFSVGDTTQLALLIDERDEILENLEIAETKYISSFKLSTPDPSIADFVPIPPPKDDFPTKPHISRPRPLGGSQRRRRRGRNPAFGSSSLPPTSFVMPSQYYKLRGVQGVNGGQFTDPEGAEFSQAGAAGPSLTDSFNQRVVGSRFQEVNRNSVAYGRLPIGSQVMVERNGEHVPVNADTPVPATALYGPNGGHSSWDTSAFSEGMQAHNWYDPHQGPATILEEGDVTEEEEWVDVLSEAPEAFEHGEEYDEQTLRRRPRPPRMKNDDSRRETFPLRNKGPASEEEQPPPHLRVQSRGPFVRPLSGLDHDDLGGIYGDITIWRQKLKSINAEIFDVQREGYNDIAEGANVKGWLMVGRGLRFVPGIQLIEGRAKEDIRWDELQNEGGPLRLTSYWTIVITTGILLGIGLTAVAGLSIATAPDISHYFPFFGPLTNVRTVGSGIGSGIATGLAAVAAATLFVSIGMWVVNYTGLLTTNVSISGSQLLVFKTTFYMLSAIGGIWLFTIGSVLFSIGAFSFSERESETVANGAIYMSAFAFMLIISVAIAFPAVLLLQPARLWRVRREEKDAITPRQRFRVGCCTLAVLLASAFTLIFPLVGPAACVLLALTLIAHRFLIGYVYGRTHSQTGGILQIWLLKRLGTILAFQPLVLGLIFLSRRLWIQGGVLCGVALFVVVFVEIYCTWKTRMPGRSSLSKITIDSLETFARSAKPSSSPDSDEESTSLVSSGRNTRARGSFASILEMMSLTLAVSPSSSHARGPVPLVTETLDDLTATERAARTHPDAPPHLPPLSFADHAQEMAGILYAPELLAPPPVIWLPNDVGGIGRSEAFDLQRYHNLRVTLDVRATEDVLPFRPSSPHARRPRNIS